jgi:DNA primase
MKIPNDKIEEIAHANDIIDIVSSYLQVKKRGKSFLALCPFHPDKNPSLHISQEKQVYHCFSCKASGNVFSFIQNYEKITFIDAAKQLAERAGIDLKFSDKSPDISNEVSKLFEINKVAMKFFQKNLLGYSGAEQEFVKHYLLQRRINDETISKFKIGYAPKNWDTLINYFSEEGIFKNEDLEKAGLIVKGENGFYDRFRGRLIFPVLNENDKVVAFGGRQLYEDDKLAKYINSPETKVYSKSKILYGLNFSKDKIRFYDYVILVEGYMDIISLAQHGIENTVASSGTALTEDQVRLISRYTKNIILLFDSDLAGIKAAKRGIELILEAGLDLGIVSLPDGEDPDSFIQKNGKAKFESFIQKKKSVINFIAGLYEKENMLSSVDDKTKFIKEIISYIGKIPDAIKRAFYIKEIARTYSLYESDLRSELDKTISQNKKAAFPKSSLEIPKIVFRNEKENKQIGSEEYELIDVFINGGEKAIEYLEKELEIDFIKDATVRKIIEYFLDEYINEGKIEVAKIMNEIDDEDIKILITKIAIEKHEVSQIPEKHQNSNNKFSDPTDVDYYLFAQDVIRKFRIRQFENIRNQIKKDPARFNEIIELGKKIDALHRRLII